MATRSKKEPKLKLIASDSKIVQAEEATVRKFKVIETMLNTALYGGPEFTDEILVPDVKANVLRLLVQWGKRHAMAEAKAEKRGKMSKIDLKRLKKWDAEFAKKLGDVLIIEVAVAADHLGANELTLLAMDRLAETIGGMTVERVEEIFSIEKNDSGTPIDHH